MATPLKAKQIVQRLTRKYGFLDEEMMDEIGEFNAEYRREIDENWLAMENAVSHSVKILSKQIYGSGARFVFELLQNAEDNIFSNAQKKKALPFISFKIHPHKIVVDCNEDGFTESDLQAICAVGQSTKSTSHGYIGAKGIGFKSVFIAASRVHIQSGNFSFEFRHKRTDPGIGMVRPIWVNPPETIPIPLTRTTLYIHDQGDPSEIQHLKTVISKQFDDLQETCLLFLRKLKQIRLEFYDEDGALSLSKRFQKKQIDDHRVSLEICSISHGSKKTRSQTFHITKQMATGLARSDNRELPDSAEARKTSSRAEVVLAFPITEESKPLITRKNQDLFAFLPLRRSDYKFLIHSDFDTNANRQDIVATSRRNLDLRDWIATAFVQAIFQLCEDPILRYNWPAFLPSQDINSDAFWSGLNSEIYRLMQRKPVLRSRTRKKPRLIGDVFILTSDAEDPDGNPLYDDAGKDLYLSPRYPQEAVDVLKEYGLKLLPVAAKLDLVENDLRRANSKMHTEDEDWHFAAARMLSMLFKGSISAQQKLKALPLLPLRTGRWVSIASGPVYFPKVGDTDIPGSLDLRIISHSASQSKARLILFRQLGVCEATNKQVRASIFRTFGSNSSGFNDMNASLKFLYLTHQNGTHTRKDYNEVKVLTDACKRNSPHKMDIYLPGKDHPYSPANLLVARDTAPGLSAPFLRSEYMSCVPDQPTLTHPSWERWLCDFIGLRERLRLISRDGSDLSDAFMYVHRHRSDRFLGLFEHLWLHEKSEVVSNRALRIKIENLSAKTLCGVRFSLKLKESWLPLKALRGLVKRYMEYPEKFCFLKLEGSGMTHEVASKWNFLPDHFSVGRDDSVGFLLKILDCIQWACYEPSFGCQQPKVLELYVAINAKISVADNASEAKQEVRQFFEAEKGVLCPHKNDPKWEKPSWCLWRAPPDMVTASSLKHLYSKMMDGEKLRSIENLFQRTLRIRNASLDDLVDELKELRGSENAKRHRMQAIYEYLDQLEESPSGLRAAFEESPLIYCETHRGESGWYKTSDCLWSSETVIRGKAILDECWEAHESFFVKKLGVKLLTLQMVYDELQQSPQTSTEEMKVAILTLNGLLKMETTALDPEPIRQARILPVRYPNGTVMLSSVNVDFAIGDRDKLKKVFCDKIRLLDFEMEDVRRLRPLIEWLRLQNRYLSNCVEESTSVSGNSGRPISVSNRDLKRKAYYIARVAATFKSPRFLDNPDQLHNQLRTMQVIESGGISSVLRIFQNKQSFEVPVATANEHIDDRKGKLVIYVPKEHRAQEICFGSVLPRKLTAWLMRSSKSLTDGPVEVEAVNALTSIFASERSVLDDILDDQGILSLPFENDDVDSNEEDGAQEHNHFGADDIESEGSGAQTLVETVSRRIRTPFRPSSSEPRRSSQAASSQGRSQSSGQPDRQVSSSLSLASTVQTVGRPLKEPGYRELLDRVVEKARKATFPSRGSFDMSDMLNAISAGGDDSGTYESFDGLNVLSRFRSANQLERDRKIGAAGELYIFELLSQLELSGWARTNWQSTIRSCVTAHPDYSDLRPWKGRETADLVYDDAEGQLTDVLIDSGYLDHDEWHGAQPTFYMEVKTTTGPCDTPFYMSGKQYKLMKRIHRSEESPEIYMIFRVFWVNSDKIDLCLYLDPEQLRQDKVLTFRGKTWAVTPGPEYV